MTSLLDNDVPDAIGRAATKAGHDVRRLRDVLRREFDDSAVLAAAHARRALLVTCNRRHFLSLASQHPHGGIVVLIRRRRRIAECSRFLGPLHRPGESGIQDNINFA